MLKSGNFASLPDLTRTQKYAGRKSFPAEKRSKYVNENTGFSALSPNSLSHAGPSRTKQRRNKTMVLLQVRMIKNVYLPNLLFVASNCSRHIRMPSKNKSESVSKPCVNEIKIERSDSSMPKIEVLELTRTIWIGRWRKKG